jgi:hypothetical protein
VPSIKAARRGELVTVAGLDELLVDLHTADFDD